MNICIVGTGYVGLVTGVCFSEMGHQVWCVDKDKEKIEQLNEGSIPIYEPGLKEMVHRNVAEGRLNFTTDFVKAMNDSLFVFIAVGTPPKEDGQADLSQILKVAKDIGDNIEEYKVIVNKSTVPVGTAAKVKDVIQQQLLLRNDGSKTIEFDVVSNPEFLKEGAAIEDFMRPDRIVIGTENVRTAELMKELYNSFVRNGHPILLMDVLSAELTKYAANAMLATRISFMNEISRVCDATGADIEQVRLGIGTDKRIGMSFLYAGIGYGGSCFPKDVQALIKTASENLVETHILNAVENVNKVQKMRIYEKVIERFGEDLSDYTFAVWGLAFKPQTDDMRDAPSIITINKLKERGAKIRAYDPVAINKAREVLGEDRIDYCQNNYSALDEADALLLLTEWHHFRTPDFEKMKSMLRKPIIFDGRNQYDPPKMHALGIEYYCIGRTNKNE